VFDWLCRTDYVDACGWIKRLVGAGGDVSALFGEVNCVGLRPGFSLVEKAVALYWDRSERTRAVEFVRDVLRRGSVGAGADYDGQTGGPVGYLAWKMMVINWLYLHPASFMLILSSVMRLTIEDCLESVLISYSGLFLDS
jgi:hypothetical protein